jgi:hypothetical protein
MHKEKGNSFIGQSKCARVVDSLYFNSSYTFTYTCMYCMLFYNLFSTTTINIVTILPAYIYIYIYICDSISYKWKRKKEKWAHVKTTSENYRE